MKSTLLLLLAGLVIQASASPLKHNTFLKHALRASKAQKSPPEDSPLIPQIGSTELLEEPPREPMGQQIKWPETSAVPQSVQVLLAGTWILMLGSLPFIMPIIDRKPVTKTQLGVGAAMLTVLFGGFFLFTNIILFQSVHFKTVRPLTIIECIYFMSQVITTVGYGDITPAKARGQVFVGFYVLGALTVIAMLISDITNHVVAMAQAYKERRYEANNPGWRDNRVRDLRSLIKPEKPSPNQLLISLGCFGVIDIIWVIFFSCYPGEGKTVFQALYMSVITLSTVGLGYFTPVTEGGMIFGAFFMLFGTAALVSTIGNFTELMVKLNEYERFKEDCSGEAIDLLKTVTKGKDQVTELQFLKFALLQMDSVPEGTLVHIQEAFDNLKPTKGVLDISTVRKSLEDSAATDVEAKDQ